VEIRSWFWLNHWFEKWSLMIITIPIKIFHRTPCKKILSIKNKFLKLRYNFLAKLLNYKYHYLIILKFTANDWTWLGDLSSKPCVEICKYYIIIIIIIIIPFTITVTTIITITNSTIFSQYLFHRSKAGQIARIL